MSQEPLDLMAIRRQAAAASRAEPTATAPLLVGSTTNIALKYTAPDGKFYEDVITVRVPTAHDDKARMGRIQAAFAGAIRFDALPEETRAWARAMATVMVLIDKPPAWLDQWMQSDDLLLFSLYNRMAEHEALFFRADLQAGSGAPGGRLVAVATELDEAIAAQAKRDRPSDT